MRIALTALTPQGPQDVIVQGDDHATVGDISAALRAGFWGAAGKIVVGPGGGSAGVTVQPLAGGPAGGPAQLLLDGEAVTAARTWPFGAILTVGTNMLAVSVPEQPDAHLSPADDGGLAYNRPPRLMPSGRPRRIEVPAEPKRGDKVRLQLLSAVIPLVLGLVMVKVLHSWAFAAFMLLSPVMIVGQWVSDRRAGRTSHTKAMRTYPERMTRLRYAIAAEPSADEADRRDAAPDPAQVLLTATGPRRRPWGRRAHDPDFLDPLVGLADL